MRIRITIPSLLLCILMAACGAEDPRELAVTPPITIPDVEEEVNDVMIADYFSILTLENYYLWSDEPGFYEKVEKELDPYTCTTPITSIKNVLSEEDPWTMLSDKISVFLDYSDGIETTPGMDVTPVLWDRETRKVFFIVNYVYANSPAEEVGIKRGDIFTKYNGKEITVDNYADYYNNDQPFTLGVAYIKNNKIVETDQFYSITPVKMYEEPLLLTKVFDINGKKVGYMVYESFTQDVNNLKAACESFKDAGVTELVLDLRFNGGGYVATSQAFASMLAPVENVKDEDIFIKNVYNEYLSEAELHDLIDQRFIKKYASSNIGLEKIYALVSGNTASASEMLLVGLSPYIDITTIGTITYGKFCSGIILKPEELFTKDFTKEYGHLYKDWGIYVMIGSFSDKDGKNACRPYGMTPDYDVADYPYDGRQLGDEEETLLRKALELAGKQYPADSVSTRATSILALPCLAVEKPTVAIQNISLKKKF